jgi:hypothetical protein
MTRSTSPQSPKSVRVSMDTLFARRCEFTGRSRQELDEGLRTQARDRRRFQPPRERRDPDLLSA